MANKLIDLTGLTTFAAKVKQFVQGKIDAVNTELAKKIDDAAKDTKKYARQNGAWVEINEGSQITVDSVMSTTSTNPVQNKVIKAAIDAVDTSVATVSSNLADEITRSSNADSEMSTKLTQLEYTLATEAEINALFA